MSCRVLHRGVEEAMLSRVASEAMDRGLEEASRSLLVSLEAFYRW